MSDSPILGAAAAETLADPSEGPRVLIAEDEPTVRLVLAGLLT